MRKEEKSRNGLINIENKLLVAREEHWANWVKASGRYEAPSSGMSKLPG